MQTGRIIHTTIDGRDQILETTDVSQLLNSENYEVAVNTLQSDTNFFPEDLALTYTLVTPEYEEKTGRSFYKIDTLIVKFTPEEILSYLKPEEVSRLLNRAEHKTLLFERMGKYLQNNGEDLTNPLPEVNL